MDIQLAMHSSPRFSTWMWFNDWRLLIDAGDGVTQQLGYKIRKIDTVAVTHAHRDHLGGLLQVVNQRGEVGSFAVAHPCGSASFGQLETFGLKFNPGTSRNAIWHALEEGDYMPTGVEGRWIKAFRTRHFADDDLKKPPRSLGFRLLWRKNKVKPEYRELSQTALDDLRAQVGREGITEVVDETWVTVGGDGAPLTPAEVAGTRLLLHEATFLTPGDYDPEDASDDVGHVHSTVADALGLAAESGVRAVVLYHISTRYSETEIRDAIRATAGELGLKARVWAALPRRVYWDMLRERPLWDGSG